MRTVIALLAAGLLVLAGCGTETSTGSGAGSEPGGTGKAADYGFAATTMDGETFEGSRLEGTPAVLWFWAPWCPTCRAQIPNLTALAEEHAGSVEVVGVGGLDSADAIRDLAEGIPHVTHLVDERGSVWQHFGVRAQSTYTVIGEDGEILAEGYLDDGELNALVDRIAS
jgi:thiol-disulfide isomerase/thioredoxin